MNSLTQEKQNDKPGSAAKIVRSVLLVDDEPLVCWALKRALEKSGFGVEAVGSAEEAIELLHSRIFDAIVTDMKLPHLDGFEVAKIARHLSDQVPIIMTTAYGDDVSRGKAVDTGINHFVDKPFDLAEIVGLVQELTRRVD